MSHLYLTSPMDNDHHAAHNYATYLVENNKSRSYLNAYVGARGECALAHRFGIVLETYERLFYPEKTVGREMLWDLDINGHKIDVKTTRSTTESGAPSNVLVNRKLPDVVYALLELNPFPELDEQGLLKKPLNLTFTCVGWAKGSDQRWLRQPMPDGRTTRWRFNRELLWSWVDLERMVLVTAP